MAPGIHLTMTSTGIATAEPILRDLTMLPQGDGLEERFRIIESVAGREQISYFLLGLQPYGKILDLQRRLHACRVAGTIGDAVLLLEHEPVYTLGKNAQAGNLLADRPMEAEVYQIDRGGDVTFHGPGQLVGYPIVDLKQHRPSVTWLMRGLETAIIAGLRDFGVAGHQKDGLTGVWIGDRKIAALGVRLARWVSMHGFAVNIAVAQQYFDGMIPCGIPEYGVVNLQDCMQTPISVRDFAGQLVPHLNNLFGG